MQDLAQSNLNRNRQSLGTQFSEWINLLVGTMDQLDETLAVGSTNSSAQLTQQLHNIVMRCGEMRLDLERHAAREHLNDPPSTNA